MGRWSRSQQTATTGYATATTRRVYFIGPTNEYVWGPWQKGMQIDMSRNGATTIYGYDVGYDEVSDCLAWQIDPPLGGVFCDEQQAQAWDYLTITIGGRQFKDRRKVSTYTRGTPDPSWPSGVNGSTTTYTYDGDNVSSKTVEDYDVIEGEPSAATWLYNHNAFGQKRLEIDPDNYAHQTDYDSNGLVQSTCTYATAVTGGDEPSGNVVQQTKFEYLNGMLWKIHVADNPGSFTKDSPANWIDTVYGYDTYGRLTSKQVSSQNDSTKTYTTQYWYDRQDRLVKVRWPDGRSKQITRDGRGQIVQVDYYGGEKLTNTYEYDDAGNLRTRITQGCPACGHETDYTYDPYNRRLTETRKGS